jgi:hypothetical protein
LLYLLLAGAGATFSRQALAFTAGLALAAESFRLFSGAQALGPFTTHVFFLTGFCGLAYLSLRAEVLAARHARWSALAALRERIEADIRDFRLGFGKPRRAAAQSDDPEDGLLSPGDQRRLRSVEVVRASLDDLTELARRVC